MTLLILAGLAVAWALVLRPARKPERSPFSGLPGNALPVPGNGFTGRLSRSYKKRAQQLGQLGELGYHGLAGHYGRKNQRGAPGEVAPGTGVRIAGSGNQSSAMRPLPPIHRGIQPFSRGGNQPPRRGGNQSLFGRGGNQSLFSRGGNSSNVRRPSQSGFAPPHAKPSPFATPKPPSVRGAIPVSVADAALRRRDITVILVTAALITLVALFITQQVWLGVLHLLFDMVLFGYLWLVTRRLHLYTGNWSSNR